MSYFAKYSSSNDDAAVPKTIRQMANNKYFIFLKLEKLEINSAKNYSLFVEKYKKKFSKIEFFRVCFKNRVVIKRVKVKHICI